MEIEISRNFTFESAHRLPKVPSGHKCGNLHGHSYRVEVVIRGSIDPNTGWLTDFANISKAFEPIHKTLDHHYLNEVEGLENPTSENLAKWIWDHLKQENSEITPYLYRVTISETCTSACHYYGK